MIHPTVNLRLVAINAALVATSTAPKPAADESEVIKLLLVMQTDTRGNISKDEFTRLADAEFNLINRDQNGTLDLNELAQPGWHARSISFLGK